MSRQSSVGEFRARLYRVATIRWVNLPVLAVERLKLPPAPKKGLNAVLRFDGDIDRVTLLPGPKGFHKLAFKVELLRAAGVDAGDTIKFTLEPDAATREPELPEEMQRAFLARPALANHWQAHSVALRRQVVRYIEQAKSPDARARRSWIFIERLAETGSLRDPGHM